MGYKQKSAVQCEGMVHRTGQKLLCTCTAFIRNISQIELSCVFANTIRHIHASIQVRVWGGVGHL